MNEYFRLAKMIIKIHLTYIMRHDTSLIPKNL